MKRIFLAAVASAMLLPASQNVLAADLPAKAVYAPPTMVAPVYNWTGCYVGANIGVAWGFAEATRSFGTDTGFAGGGQVGCDYQVGQWVIGARNMFDGTTINGGATWFDTLTGRGGYLVQPNVLLYAQGGAAWAETTNTTGWTVGGGVEWMFVPRWSTFLEYNYMDFGTVSGTFGSARSDTQTVLVGLNYKF
jgi:outer membrane immunogenic protein